MRVGDEISLEFGIPIVNKRISVTPVAIAAACCETDNYVEIARTLDRAAAEVGVNFIGGFSALVQKGTAASDQKLINSVPRGARRDGARLLLRQPRLEPLRHQHGRGEGRWARS